MVPRSITDDLQCLPLLKGKMRKVPVRRMDHTYMSGSEVHFNHSVPFRPSLGGNNYALHLMEARTSMPERVLLGTKEQTTDAVQSFVTGENNRFASDGHPVRTLRAANAREF